MGPIPGLGRSPGEENWKPTPVLFPWEISWKQEPGGLQFMGSQDQTKQENNKHMFVIDHIFTSRISVEISHNYYERASHLVTLCCS